jgi:hypothetical protein
MSCQNVKGTLAYATHEFVTAQIANLKGKSFFYYRI